MREHLIEEVVGETRGRVVPVFRVNDHAARPSPLADEWQGLVLVDGPRERCRIGRAARTVPGTPHSTTPDDGSSGSADIKGPDAGPKLPGLAACSLVGVVLTTQTGARVAVRNLSSRVLSLTGDGSDREVHAFG